MYRSDFTSSAALERNKNHSNVWCDFVILQIFYSFSLSLDDFAVLGCLEVMGNEFKIMVVCQVYMCV